MAAADVQIPKTHRGVVYDKPGTVSCKVEENLETPEPGPGQVLVKITHSGVCHSDMSIMNNGWHPPLPAPTAAGQVGGHEGVGHIVKMGPGSESSNVKTGDRVGIKWVSSACGACDPCLNNRDGLCAKGTISGYYTPGTFQQYTLAPAHYVTPIPEKLDSAAAAPILCGGVTVHSALRQSGCEPGDWVAVIGAGGGLGHLAVQIAAKGMGYRVIGIDHSSKRSLVLSLGAEHFIAFDEHTASPEALADAVKGPTSASEGANAVLVLVGSDGAYATATNLLTKGGRLMVVGIPEGSLNPIAGAIPAAMVFKELTIRGVAVGTRLDAIRALEMAERGVVKPNVEVVGLEGLSGVFDRMGKGEVFGRVVVDVEK